MLRRSYILIDKLLLEHDKLKLQIQLSFNLIRTIRFDANLKKAFNFTAFFVYTNDDEDFFF